jgi:hypothetical protein
MGQGPGDKLLAGFLALHVVCCGLVLLLGAGVLSSAGTLLGSPLLIAGGLGALAVGSLRMLRRRRRAVCCAPADAIRSADPAVLGVPARDL